MSKHFFKIKRLCLSVMLLLLNSFLFAQAAADTNGAAGHSFMRSNDKIYVVMAVCITILAVLFFYLIRIDNKVSKKERLS